MTWYNKNRRSSLKGGGDDPPKKKGKPAPAETDTVYYDKENHYPLRSFEGRPYTYHTLDSTNALVNQSYDGYGVPDSKTGRPKQYYGEGYGVPDWESQEDMEVLSQLEPYTKKRPDVVRLKNRKFVYRHVGPRGRRGRYITNQPEFKPDDREKYYDAGYGAERTQGKADDYDERDEQQMLEMKIQQMIKEAKEADKRGK